MAERVSNWVYFDPTSPDLCSIRTFRDSWLGMSTHSEDVGGIHTLAHLGGIHTLAHLGMVQIYE